jgi:hypothetical protein
MVSLAVKSALAICLGLALSACEPAKRDYAVDRQQITEIPMEIQREMTALAVSGDENEGLTEEEWAKLEEFARHSDPRVRAECAATIGGISYKTSPQRARVAEFLRKLAQDEDPDVKAAALGMLTLYEEKPQ